MATERRMIEPFAENRARAGVISYGVSSYGYDMRVAPEFKIFTNALSAVVDPKQFDPKSFVEFAGDVCIVPPNSFALARSVEYFRIPRNVLTICVGKSTYARCGIITNVTPFEPEWEGFVTLEISNTTPLPARIYANEGIAQVVALLLYAYATASAISARAKNDAMRYSASRFARSYNTILRPAPAATTSPVERTSLRSSWNPSRTRAPAYTSQKTLRARSPARGARRPK